MRGQMIIKRPTNQPSSLLPFLKAAVTWDFFQLIGNGQSALLFIQISKSPCTTEDSHNLRSLGEMWSKPIALFGLMALWPSESFRPSPQRQMSSYALQTFFTTLFMSLHTSSATGAAQCFWKRRKVISLIKLKPRALTKQFKFSIVVARDDHRCCQHWITNKEKNAAIFNNL